MVKCAILVLVGFLTWKAVKQPPDQQYRAVHYYRLQLAARMYPGDTAAQRAYVAKLDSIHPNLRWVERLGRTVKDSTPHQ